MQRCRRKKNFRLNSYRAPFKGQRCRRRGPRDEPETFSSQISSQSCTENTIKFCRSSTLPHFCTKNWLKMCSSRTSDRDNGNGSDRGGDRNGSNKKFRLNSYKAISARSMPPRQEEFSTKFLQGDFRGTATPLSPQELVISPWRRESISGTRRKFFEKPQMQTMVQIYPIDQVPARRHKFGGGFSFLRGNKSKTFSISDDL